MLKDSAISIVRNLQEAGYQAYFVGGCVRDMILDREPADYDVATDASPDEVMRIFPETYAVGAQFGVVLIPAPGRRNGACAISAERDLRKDAASCIATSPVAREGSCSVSAKSNLVEV